MGELRQWVVAVVMVLAVTVGAAYYAGPVSAQDGQTPEELCAGVVDQITEPETRQFDQAENVLQEGVDYWAVLCTEAGAVYLDLYETEAPVTVNNFVFLAENGYYNNTTFHRVLPGFMAQGGDPTGTGSGGPGYQFEDETENGLVFDDFGLLAMANSGADTNGSQFFITYALTSWLDGGHTIFGRVYAGMDTAERLRLRDPENAPPYEGARLDTVLIVEDPDAVIAEADGKPPIEHFQYLLQTNIADQLSGFGASADVGYPRDITAEAATVAEIAGEEMGAVVQNLLADSGFVGAAGFEIPLGECSANPEENPIWFIGMSVQEYDSATAAEAVTADDQRSEALVAGGLYETWEESAVVFGRVYSRQDQARICGDTGVFYHLELAFGRYVLTTDLVLDSRYVSPDTETTPDLFLGYVADQFLFSTIGGTLERANSFE